eukprot:SAG25_NODE_1365_length_3197_cov_2.128793_4_plen_63_part_00
MSCALSNVDHHSMRPPGSTAKVPGNHAAESSSAREEWFCGTSTTYTCYAHQQNILFKFHGHI